MKAVNLLPAGYQAERQVSLRGGLPKHPVAVGGTLGAVVVGALLFTAFHSASNQVTQRQSQLTAIQAQIAAVAQPENTSDQTVRDRINQVTAADATRVSWDGFMQKLSKVLPEDTWLNTMQFGSTASVPGAVATPATTVPTSAPTGFTVTGYTYSQPSVARVMRRLSLLPWLSNVQLQTSSETVVGANSVYQFTIVGAVNALPAKEAS